MSTYNEELQNSNAQISNMITLANSLPDAAPDYATIVDVAVSSTLDTTNGGRFIRCVNSSAITITIPAGLDVGVEIEVCRFGAGTVTFAAATDVTINSVDGALTIANQYGVAVLKQVATNVWLLAGDLG